MPHAATLIRALFGQTVSSFTTLDGSGGFNESETNALLTSALFTSASFGQLGVSGTLLAPVRAPPDDLLHDTSVLLRSGLHVRKKREWFGDTNW